MRAKLVNTGASLPYADAALAEPPLAHCSVGWLPCCALAPQLVSAAGRLPRVPSATRIKAGERCLRPFSRVSDKEIIGCLR